MERYDVWKLSPPDYCETCGGRGIIKNCGDPDNDTDCPDCTPPEPPDEPPDYDDSHLDEYMALVERAQYDREER